MTKNFRLVVAALIAVVIGIIYAAMCYGPITGKVVDADSGKPIEGAVVLVEWTRTKGIGLTATYSYKVAATITDKDGKFELPGTYNPLVNKPILTIYKKGYVAWNNELIFPGYTKRTNFIWQAEYVVKMEKYNEKYSHDKHVDFIMTSIRSSLDIESKNKIYKAFEWERKMALRERMKK